MKSLTKNLKSQLLFTLHTLKSTDLEMRILNKKAADIIQPLCISRIVFSEFGGQTSFRDLFCQNLLNTIF